jgi:hypothetical protein
MKKLWEKKFEQKIKKTRDISSSETFANIFSHVTDCENENKTEKRFAI